MTVVSPQATMSLLLLLCVSLPFISATVTLEAHKGKSPELEAAFTCLVSERGK